MPFVLILLGLMIFVSSYRGTIGTFSTMLRDDIFGTQSNHGFLYWAVAIFIVGAIGYIKSLKGLSDSFIVLLIIVLFLANKGFFAQFNNALQQIGSTTPANNNIPSPLGNLTAGNFT